MKVALQALALLIALTHTSPYAFATTWTDQRVADPLRPTDQCTVKMPASWGTYIFRWPSRYERVYWPDTDPSGIWHCDGSGYTALMRDFFEITEEESQRLKDFLGQYQLPADTTERTLSWRLELLEALNKVRGFTKPERVRRLAAIAYIHERVLQDFSSAADNRRQALELIESQLNGGIDDPIREIEYHYLAAAYHRYLDNPELSDGYLEMLGKLLSAAAPNPALSSAVRFFRELSADVPRMRPNGRLAPD